MASKADDLSRAAGEMDQAAGQLSGQNPAGAMPHQKQAIEELKRKRDELTELHRKMRQELFKPTGQQAKEQSGLADKTQQTAEEMKGSQGSPSAPGQSSVGQASQSMSKASGQLDKSDTSGANASQKQAISDLERAARELQEAIDREREMMQAEALAKIDEMLELILARQKAIDRDTTKVYTRRGGEGYARQDQIKLAELSAGQGKLDGETQKVVEMLDKEGTTVVFPSVLREVREDMQTVRTRLGEQKADELTQSIQTEIERNLQEMIDALKKELSKRRREGGGGGMPGGGMAGGKQPLVPPAAELKLLRALQIQINRRTVVLADQKAKQAMPEPDVKAQHKKLAEREKRVETMTRQIAKRMQMGAPGGPGR